MLYTLKCNPNQNPACGEWDYLTYTYMYQPAVQSFTANAANYQENGMSPDSFSYITSPAYQLTPHKQYFVVNDDTISYSAFKIGGGADSSFIPFNTSVPVSRTQYVWKAHRLQTAGMTAGNITGMQFKVLSVPGMLKNLSIRIKNSSLDSLTSSQYENSGFTDVYQFNTSFVSTGWNSLAFTTPFYWDGISNVVLEVTYDNTTAFTDFLIAANEASWQNSINTSGNEQSAHFNDANYISVPAGAFATVDSQITIAFWFKGDNFLEDRTTFEAIDVYNHRVLNVHLPWSDQNIYWDAGDDVIGNYNRISKHADSSDYRNTWHYWAFEKNCTTGSMKIFRDGSLWHSGTGASLLMKNVKTFWIGSALWNINVSANASLDEFAAWNKEVDSTTLKAYMYKDLDANHPYHSNLLVYYHFNDNDGFTVEDASGNNFDGSIIGAQLPLYDAADLFRNIQNINRRAQIKLEQGVYNSHIDSMLVFDTTWINPISLVLFNDSLNPNVPTDTQLVWLPYYQYVYDAQGNIIDSNYIAEDTTIHLQYTPYNTGPIPVLTNWELARYITPYGINLSLGSGWTWTYDVSDYASLLHDSVYLSAGNWQELLDVKFMFIKGKPSRKVLGIQNLWNGDFGWGTNTENDLAPKKVLIPANAKNSRVKLRITGHGEDNNNCAEFCTNTAYFKVNGQQEYQKEIWRSTCPLNPLYPQGGTWIFERANWCPGAEVQTYDWELTPFVTPGDSALLDIDLNPYSGSGGANYVTESQLISYGDPNFSLDAEVNEILSPVLDSIHRRHNPICNDPLVAIRNDGSTALTSLTITYGIEGATQSVYQWTGHLNIMDTAQVRLGAFFSSQGGNSNKFIVTVSNPNGGVDENSKNDTATSYFKFPRQYPSHIYIELKTNYHPMDNAYTITDDQGNVIFSKGGLIADTLYRDTLELANGCYTFRLTDSGEDGLFFWFFDYYGSGYARIRNADNGSFIKNFGADFGSELYQQFTVGYYLNTEELPQVSAATMNVYPNPTHGEAWADIFLPQREDAEVFMTDLTGKIIYHQLLQNILSYGLTIDLKDEPAGMYLLQVKVKEEVITKKILVVR